MINKSLEKLIGKTVKTYQIGEDAYITIVFTDGTTFCVQAYPDDYDYAFIEWEVYEPKP